jgi:hypothetical protein
LTPNQWKCSTQDYRENNCVDTCIDKFYSPPKTPKIESEGGVKALDFGDMKVEHIRSMLKLTKTIINKITVETKKLKINRKDKKCKNT